MTITSGFAGYDLAWFPVLSLLTRGARFFILAALLSRFGPAIRTYLDRNSRLPPCAAAALSWAGVVLFRFLI